MSALAGALGGAAWLAQVLGLFLAATVVFDVVHWALHRMAAARDPRLGRLRPWLRRLGALHQTHHAWFDRRLQHDPALEGANLRHHVVPEFLTHAGVSLLLLVWLPASVVLPVLGLQTLVFLLILRTRGLDVNHRPRTRVRAAPPIWFCHPHYHLLHHVHPEAHFSSWIKAFDQLAGTGLALGGRRAVVSGDAGPLGEALRRAGVRVEALDPADPERALREADVLVLARATAADLPLVETLCRLSGARIEPPEVWALAPSADFEPHARRYWRDPRVLYRHVPRPGRGALFFLRRGFHYVPATPGALLGFPRFRLGLWRAAAAGGATLA